MLIVVALGGAFQFLEQGVILHSPIRSPLATEINEDWYHDSERLIINDEGKFISFGFFGTWLGKISETHEARVQIIEKRLPLYTSSDIILDRLKDEPGLARPILKQMRKVGLGWLELGNRRTTVFIGFGTGLVLLMLGFAFPKNTPRSRNGRARREPKAFNAPLKTIETLNSKKPKRSYDRIH